VIYLIYGQEDYFIRQKINELISNAKGEIVHFNGSDNDFTINKMLDACLTNNLFSDFQTILVNDPYFLTKKLEDNELKDLYEYINNPIYESDLILYTYINSFNLRLKLFKDLSKNAQIFNFEKYNYQNFNNYTRQRISETKLNISKDAVEDLINICNYNASLFEKNLEILNLYPDKIDKEVVKALCQEPEEIDAFKLINALTDKNITKTITIERKMFSQSDSLYSIIGLLAGQLRFLYQVAYLDSKGMSTSQIMEITNANEIRIRKSKETLNKLNMDQILDLLNELSNLDCKYKSDNSISDLSRFELFVLNLLKRNNYASN